MSERTEATRTTRRQYVAPVDAPHTQPQPRLRSESSRTDLLQLPSSLSSVPPYEPDQNSYHPKLSSGICCIATVTLQLG